MPMQYLVIVVYMCEFLYIALIIKNQINMKETIEMEDIFLAEEDSFENEYEECLSMGMSPTEAIEAILFNEERRDV